MHCLICGEPLASGTRTCPNCGTTAADEGVPTATAVTSTRKPPAAIASVAALAPGYRFCPACGASFAPAYTDAFCRCGVELVTPPGAIPSPVFEAPEAPKLQSPFDMPPDRSFSLEAEDELPRPPPGTPCLVLYSAEKKPLHWFPLTKDALLIGRTDAVAGIFPDIDLDALLDPAQARKASRRHALVLRQRGTGTYSLRPLAGNTGTQIDSDMVAPQEDYPLSAGQRFILGGTVRFKFEIS